MAMYHENFEYCKSLGSGSFGDVYAVRNKTDGRLCAAKQVKIPTSSLPYQQKKIWERFCQECEILLKIQHPNIVQCLGIICDRPPMLLLMELMTESLSAYLERQILPLKYYIQVNLCHGIIGAVEYLHSHKIIHRDLSSNNILLSGENETLIAKVGDFGMVKLITELNPSIQLTNNPGTEQYMPPEALSHPANYNEKIDIFSYGVLVIQILTCKFPEPNKLHQNVRQSEEQRRQNHIQLINKTHPLLCVALSCIKDSDKDRPPANELVQYMKLLINSQVYEEVTSLHNELSAMVNQQSEAQQKKLQEKIRKLQHEIGKLKQPIHFHRENWRSVEEADRQIRRSVDAVICGSNVYIRPAHDRGEILNFDLDSESWRGQLEHVYMCSTLASVDDKLIAIGGTLNRAHDSPCTEKVFCLRPVQQEWPQMQHRRCRCTATTYQNKWLIVIGGEHPTGTSLNSVEVMNTKTWQWSYTVSLPKTQYSCSTAIVNNNLYVLGGWTEREKPLKVAFKCNVDSLIENSRSRSKLSWEMLLTNPPVAQTTCVSYNGALLTIGGTWCKCYDCRCSEPTKNIYMYSEDIDEWDCIGSTPVAHYLCLGCVQSNKKIIIIGGAVSKDEALTNVYVHQ